MRALAGQLGWYTAIGAASTAAYLGLYALLQGPIGTQPANLTGWLVTAVGDTAANRRLTFGVLGRRGAFRAQAQGLLVFGIALALTSGSLAALNAAVAAPGRLLELSVLLGANLAAGVLRFLLLRGWVFRARG